MGSLLKEAMILENPHHPHVVRMVAYWEDEQEGLSYLSPKTVHGRAPWISIWNHWPFSAQRPQIFDPNCLRARIYAFQGNLPPRPQNPKYLHRASISSGPKTRPLIIYYHSCVRLLCLTGDDILIDGHRAIIIDFGFADWIVNEPFTQYCGTPL